VVEADLRRENDEGEIYSPLDKATEPRPNPEQRLSAKQTLELIDRLFKDDEKAQMVLTAWQEGYEPAGVRELWDLSQNEYNTIVRRIRRRLDTSALTATVTEEEVMANNRTDKEKLDALIDALGDSVLEASDEDLLEELRMNGVDPDAEARA